MKNRNELMNLWRIPQNAELGDVITIRVKRSCGHSERHQFEGIVDGENYRMPFDEAQRLDAMKRSICLSCDD